MKRLMITIAVLMLGNIGCTDFVKNSAMENADWLAMYKIDEYFDLTDDQDEIVKPFIIQEIKTIQKVLIPVLIKELAEVSANSDKLSREELDKYFVSQPKQHWMDFIMPKLPMIADFFELLTAKQLEHFDKVYAEQFEDRWELANESEDDFPDEFRDLQEERLEKLEQWYGPFDEEQQKVIFVKTKQSLAEYKEETLRYKARRELFMQRTREIKTKEERVVFLKEWITLRNKQGEEEDAKATKTRSRSIDFWVFIEGLLTAKQRKKRQEKINKIITDLKYFQTVKY